MKRKKGLLVLTFLVVVAVGLSFWDFSTEKKKEEIKQKESQIVILPKNQISEIEILGAVKIQREKVQAKGQEGATKGQDGVTKGQDGVTAQGAAQDVANEIWKIVTPIEEVADSGAVGELLSALENEKAIETVVEGGQVDFGVFGLVKPISQIILKTEGGETQKISFSSIKNFQGDSYLRINDQNKVLVASASFNTKAIKSLFDLRNKKLFQNSGALVNKITYQKQDRGEKFEMILKEGVWKAKDQPEWKLDSKKIKDFIDKLAQTDATEILTPGLDDKVKKESLDAEVIFSFGAKEDWTLSLDKAKKEETFSVVRTSFPNRKVKINKAEGEKLQKLKLDEFRDRQFPFLLTGSEKIKKIRLMTELKTSLYHLNGTAPDEQWILEPTEPEIQVQQEKIKNLISSIPTLEVSEFVNGSSPKPTNKDRKEIRFMGEDGGIIFEMNLSDIQKRKVNGVEKNMYLSKTNLSDMYFWIDETALQRLSLNELSKKVSANPPSKLPSTGVPLNNKTEQNSSQSVGSPAAPGSSP